MMTVSHYEVYLMWGKYEKKFTQKQSKKKVVINYFLLYIVFFWIKFRTQQNTHLRVCRLPFAIFERNVQRIQHGLQPKEILIKFI
jgi:hypothetical protein